MKLRQHQYKIPITHESLKKKVTLYARPPGFIRLLNAVETNEDLFRIAYLSERYSYHAQQEIEIKELTGAYKVWVYFQNKAYDKRNYKSKQ